MSLLMVPIKVDKDYLKLKGGPEGLILTLTWVSITFHCDGLWTFFFLVALWFVVAASCLKNVLKGRRKQCPGVKVCFLIMLRSSLSYNKVIKMFFSFG